MDSLFDADGLAADAALTMHENPDLARPARAGFLAGMFVIWKYEGKATAAQRSRLLDLARTTLATLGED